MKLTSTALTFALLLVSGVRAQPPVPDIPTLDSFQEVSCICTAMYHVDSVDSTAFESCSPTSNLELLWYEESEESVNSMVVVSHTRDMIYLAHVGTVGIKDTFISANLVPANVNGVDLGRVHEGVALRLFGPTEFWRTIAQQVESAMDMFPTYNVELIGHSLGGLEALLLGAVAAATDALGDKKVVVKTLAAPRAGDITFKNVVEGMDNLEIWRLVYQDDPVPRFPDRAWTAYESSGHLLLQHGDTVKAYYNQYGLPGVFSGVPVDDWQYSLFDFDWSQHAASTYQDGLERVAESGEWPDTFAPPDPNACCDKFWFWCTRRCG